MKRGSTDGTSFAGILGSCWGILGLSLIFGSALYRLYPYVQELEDLSLNGVHRASLAASLLFMGYAEGYKGFHLKFSPRAAARALYLKNNPTFARVLFAPLFCMGFFHATRKRKIVSYSLTLMIIGLILWVKTLETPWRGIIDAGVLLGLGWGLVSVWLFSIKAFFGKSFDVSPETPEA